MTNNEFMTLGEYPYYAIAEYRCEAGENQYYRCQLLNGFGLATRHTGLKNIQQTPFYITANNELILRELLLVVSAEQYYNICNADDNDTAVLGLIAEPGVYRKHAPDIMVPERSLYDIIGNDVTDLIVWGMLIEEKGYKQFPNILDQDVEITYHQMRERHRAVDKPKKDVIYGPDGERLPPKGTDTILGLDDLPF